MDTARFVSPDSGAGSRTDRADAGRLGEAACSVLLLLGLGTIWIYARVESAPMCEYMAADPLPRTAADIRPVRTVPTFVADDREAGL